MWGDTVPLFGATFHTMKNIYIYNPAQTTMTGGDKSNNWKEKHNNQPDNDADADDDDDNDDDNDNDNGKNKDKDEDEDKDE